MHIIRLIALCASFLGAALMSAVAPAHAQDSVAITVEFAPPPLPVYDQPPIPGSGYIWAPGYWAWSNDVGWYWVPGGFCHRRSACYGRRPIGHTVKAPTCSTTDIGRRKSVSTGV